MGVIFAYSITAGLLLLAMYPVYKWLMAGEKQHSFNRAIIWAIYLTALCLPLVIPSLKETTCQLTADTSSTSGNITVDLPQITEVGTQLPSWPRILLWIYTLGVVISFIGTILVAFRLKAIITAGEKTPCGKYTLVITDNPAIAPFSWLRFIVMNRNDFNTSGKAIILHETRHLDLTHWIDLALAQCVAIFMWYNPAAWLMREELKAVHEYQADDAVITSGSTDIKEYQLLLVKKAVGARFPSLANSLNHSKLKKRITMMQKNRSNAARRMRAFALLPAATAAIAAAGTIAVSSMLSMASAATLSVSSDNKVKEKTLTIQNAGKKTDINLPDSADYYINGTKQTDRSEINRIPSESISSITVSKDSGTTAIFIETDKNNSKKPVPIKALDSQPEFPGGITNLVKYLQNNLRYPASALKSKTEGKVVVRFIVDTNGKMSESEIIRSVSPELDAEALRVLSEMPDWTPGMLDGKPVECHYVLPVTFKIPDPIR